MLCQPILTTGIVRVGGRPTVVAQWQSTGGSSKRCPGFDSWWLPTFLLSSIFIYFQHEARCSEQAVSPSSCLGRTIMAHCMVPFHDKLLSATMTICFELVNMRFYRQLREGVIPI